MAGQRHARSNGTDAESDVFEFVVGTRINEAHQEPNVPLELDLRRNIVRRIAGFAREKIPYGMLGAVSLNLARISPFLKIIEAFGRERSSGRVRFTIDIIQ